MGNIICYDYTNQQRAYVRCGLINSNDLQNATDHTFELDGVTYTVTKSPNHISIRQTGNNVDDSGSYQQSVIQAAGIRCQDIFLGEFANWMTSGSDIRYGFNSDYQSAPYFNLSWGINSSSNKYQSMVIQPPTQGSFSIGPFTDFTGGSATIHYYMTVEYAPTDPANLTGIPVFINVMHNTNNVSATASSLQIDIYYFPDWNAKSEADPGESGFKPTGDYTDDNFPGIGGRPSDDPHKTDPDYPSDTILQPGAPDESVASAAGSGFITAYKMTTANLRELGKCLFSQNLTDALLNVLINPLDFIVSLNVFPCSPSVGAAVPIKLGRWECRSGALTGALGFNASGSPLTHQFSNPPLDFGTISIPENWGSFLDYTHTRIELYLPFIGTVDLDVSECMGGTVNVQYTIDYFTGMCVANVLCLRPITLASGKVIGTRPAQHSYQGNCAIQVPLSAESYGSMLGNIINSCTRLIGNPAMAPVSLAEGVLNGLNPSVTTKGSIVANAGFCSVLKPYVRITRPVTAAPASYQQVVGYPSYINAALNQCTGFCQCEDINLSGIIGATEAELEEIRALCKDGIII